MSAAPFSSIIGPAQTSQTTLVPRAMGETGAPLPTPFATAGNPRLRILVPLIVGCAFFMEGRDSTALALRQWDAPVPATSVPGSAQSLGRR